MLRNIFLICILVTVAACQKESGGPGIQPIQPNQASPGVADRTEKQQIFNAAPVYEYYTGACKMSLNIRYSNAFTDNQDVSARIRIRGSNNLSGTNTLFDFETTIYNQDRWVEVNIPESAHIFITLLEVSVPFMQNDYIKLRTGEFGYNKAQNVLTSNPYNGFFPNIEQSTNFIKYAPYSSDTGVYLCAPWCTWRVDYSVGGDPLEQDGPNFAFRYVFGLSDGFLKTYNLTPNTTGSFLCYPISPSSQNSPASVVYYCQANEPAPDPPPFCYEIHSQDNTVYPPQTPAPQPPYLYSLSYGLSPNMTCDAVCRMIPETINIPQCERKFK